MKPKAQSTVLVSNVLLMDVISEMKVFIFLINLLIICYLMFWC